MQKKVELKVCIYTSRQHWHWDLKVKILEKVTTPNTPSFRFEREEN
jgi:hypothetical protein